MAMRYYAERYQRNGRFNVVGKIFIQISQCRKQIFAFVILNVNNMKTRLSKPQVIFQKMTPESNSLSYSFPKINCYYCRYHNSFIIFRAPAMDFKVGGLKKQSNLPKNVAPHGWATKKILVSRVSRMASKSISGSNCRQKFPFY